VDVFGQRLSELDREGRRQIERRWGVMFQQGALFSSLTVRENVMVPLKEHAHMPLSMMRDVADLKIRMAGLPPEAATKFPSELSGGMIKRAALARALALDPPLLFLDEPTAGLDPISAGNFDLLIRDLCNTLGLTVFLVTHDVDTLVAVCDRIAVLKGGKVAAIGSLDEITREATGWIASYFDGPRGRAAIRGGRSAAGEPATNPGPEGPISPTSKEQV
jgi:phospholipid/cholesterol/gamma-HCH transport system ATP-binding protein